MRSRAVVRRGQSSRQDLYPILLILGVAGLFGLLLTDMQMTLFARAIPAAGELAAKLTPVTSGPSMDGFGAFSPDGKQIAFMRDGQIMLTDPTGKRIRPLTSEPEAWDANPVWRPDGKAIAYIRLAAQGEQAQVMSLDLEKGRPKELAREATPIGYLVWSPDGRTLYYTTQDRIMRIDLARGQKERVFAAPAGWELLSGGLAVAQDHKSLIFGGGPRRSDGVAYDLYRLPLDGAQAQPQRLTTKGGIMPALDPTGRLVAFRNPREQTGIYLLNLATRAVERELADEPRAMYFHPNFSPDGQRLLLSRLLLAPAPARGRGGFTSNLYLHSLKGSGGDP